MAERQIIVVDTETTGLKNHHVAVEVAWWNLTTDERGHFFPWVQHRDRVIHEADPKALELNGFYDRIKPTWDSTTETRQDEVVWFNGSHFAWVKLKQELEGNILAGSNPAFDAKHLARAIGEVWHHRKLDLANYAAGTLALLPTELPGLARVCELLGIEPGDHTAEADVTATGKCIRRLIDVNAQLRGRGES